MDNKKVLILSLGRGNETGKKFNYAKASERKKEKHLRQNINNKESAYQTANYVFENETEAERNVFIATSLLKKEKPDIVFIVGTPGSSWTSFYVNHKKTENDDSFSKVKSRFGKRDSSIDKQYELLRPIWDVEESNTNDAKVCEPLIQSVIEGLKDVFGVEQIKAIVLPTGKNEEELEWIYSHLNEMIKSELNDDCTYDVAFDITHSFRSIPFYNYAILNYLKQVTDVKLNINKIYYGAFEAKYKLENGKLATPIIELNKVTNIMNLTNAVFGFNETGSVKGLMNLLEKLENKDNGMISILSKLEWAIESNNGDAVYDCFVNMVEFINENSSQEVNEYTDILNAIKNALSIPFYNGRSLFDIKETNDPIEYSNNQLVLAKWYLSKHRYSQALCVACEAYRSYLACIYCDGIVDYIKKETNRKYAKDNFQKAIKYANENNMKDLNAYNSLIESYKKAYDLRNSSAHNLKNNIASINLNDMNNIALFFSDLENFANILNTKNGFDKIRNLCFTKTTIQSKESYLFLFKRKSEFKINELNDKLKIKLNILPKELQIYLSSGISIDDNDIFEIGKYIESVFDLKTLNILINEDVNKDVVIKLCQLFDCLGIKADKVKTVDNNLRFTKRDFPKLLFDPVSTPYDEYDNRYFNLKIETLLTNPLNNQEKIIDDIYNSNNDIDSKIDIIMNNTLNLIFEKVDTDCPQSNHLKVLNDLTTRYGFINTVINDNSNIIVEYKKAFETDTSNKLINEIKIDNYSIKGKNGLNNLKQFSRLLVYYSLIIKDKNSKKRNEKYTQSYIDEYVKLLER